MPAPFCRTGDRRKKSDLTNGGRCGIIRKGIATRVRKGKVIVYIFLFFTKISRYFVVKLTKIGYIHNVSQKIVKQ